MVEPDIPRGTLTDALSAFCSRVDETLAVIGDAFPYFANPKTGEWETTPNGNWCGGHWVGLLWLAAEHADDPTEAHRYETAACDHIETMYEYMPRDSMFCGMNFYYAGFRGYDVTGDRSLFSLGLEAADAMVTSFHEGARQIPLGGLDIQGPEQFRGPKSAHGPAGDRVGAVDNVYTALPVLWRAYRETRDEQFRDIALAHADRHLDWYIREDGSTWHHAVFDRETGALERQYNELALSDDTCWARGQGWSIAGLSRAYAETGAGRYLDAVGQMVDYYRRNSPPDEIPYWDFAADNGEPRDTSAAALTAYGLTGLPVEPRTEELRSYGSRVLESLLDDYLVTDPDASTYGSLHEGCFNRPGRYADNNELIWADYYTAVTVASLLPDR